MYWFILLGSVLFAFAVVWLVEYFRSPFRYPYFRHTFDVSGKRMPDIDDLLDEFLINGGFDVAKRHLVKIGHWKQDCKQAIAAGLFKNYRYEQYLAVLDDEHAFRFDLVRMRTKYRQQNYVKTSYKEPVVVESHAYSFKHMQDRYFRLRDIGFQCTLKNYEHKNQRKLMTRQFREQIMRRDNYTCRICGKYMPDEVGLQIDHVVPVSKGGKSVPSNLQVLCSKCNGRKSNKT